MSESRASVLDCGSPLPLCVTMPAVKKRQRAAAVQNLAEILGQPSSRGYGLLNPLNSEFPADLSR